MTLAAETTARRNADLKLQGEIDRLTERVSKLEQAAVPAPPVIVPPPPPPVITPTRQTINTTGVGILIPAGTVDRVIEGIDFIGPQTGNPTKTSGQFGIRALGTAASPIKRLTIRYCTFRGFGFGGIWLEFVQQFAIEDCVIDGVGYSGIMAISSTDGLINKATVRNVGVAYYNAWTSGMEIDPALNAYGIAFSDYGGAQSERMKVTSSTVDNVPGWHGIDGHSANSVTLEDNIVTRCNRAYWSASTGRRPHDWILNRNQALSPTPRPDVRNQSPYNEVAFTMLSTDRVSGSGNVAVGWPQKLDTGGSTAVTVGVS